MLGRVAKSLPEFPGRPSPRCRVAVEAHPDGSTDNRVDVQVDDPGFFLLVEVKIDAPEGPDQIPRYCRIAQARACGRPWAVAYLTIKGLPPSSAGVFGARVVPLSWSAMARALRGSVSPKDRGARRMGAAPRFLASKFADHMKSF